MFTYLPVKLIYPSTLHPPTNDLPGYWHVMGGASDNIQHSDTRCPQLTLGLNPEVPQPRSPA